MFKIIDANTMSDKVVVNTGNHTLPLPLLRLGDEPKCASTGFLPGIIGKKKKMLGLDKGKQNSAGGSVRDLSASPPSLSPKLISDRIIASTRSVRDSSTANLRSSDKIHVAHNSSIPVPLTGQTRMAPRFIEDSLESIVSGDMSIASTSEGEYSMDDMLSTDSINTPRGHSPTLDDIQSKLSLNLLKKSNDTLMNDMKESSQNISRNITHLSDLPKSNNVKHGKRPTRLSISKTSVIRKPVGSRNALLVAQAPILRKTDKKLTKEKEPDNTKIYLRSVYIGKLHQVQQLKYRCDEL